MKIQKKFLLKESVTSYKLFLPDQDYSFKLLDPSNSHKVSMYMNNEKLENCMKQKQNWLVTKYKLFEKYTIKEKVSEEMKNEYTIKLNKNAEKEKALKEIEELTKKIQNIKEMFYVVTNGIILTTQNKENFTYIVTKKYDPYHFTERGRHGADKHMTQSYDTLATFNSLTELLQYINNNKFRFSGIDFKNIDTVLKKYIYEIKEYQNKIKNDYEIEQSYIEYEKEYNKKKEETYNKIKNIYNNYFNQKNYNYDNECVQTIYHILFKFEEYQKYSFIVHVGDTIANLLGKQYYIDEIDR